MGPEADEEKFMNRGNGYLRPFLRSIAGLRKDDGFWPLTRIVFVVRQMGPPHHNCIAINLLICSL